MKSRPPRQPRHRKKYRQKIRKYYRHGDMPVIIFTDMMKKLRETKGGATLLAVILTAAIIVMIGIYFLLGGHRMLIIRTMTPSGIRMYIHARLSMN